MLSSPAPAAMLIHLTHADLASDLLRFLEQRVDVVGHRVGDDVVEVSLLGSRRQPYNRLELDARLRAWRAAHPDVGVTVSE